MLRLLLEDYVKKYTAEDINLIEVLKDYPKLRSDNGPWLAGGALLRLMTNEKLSEGDLDFYFPNSDRRRRFITYIHAEAHATWKGMKYKTKPIEINTISMDYFKSIKDIFDTYDFSICQLATDGYYIYCSQQTLDDIENRVIRPDKEFTIERYLKYFYRGYNGHEQKDKSAFWDWWFYTHKTYIVEDYPYTLDKTMKAHYQS